ncbi:MAG: site-specific integrase [Firmicutes bacterium HGW-Firmicutes-16]|nr:MAG: site-specific integrase [Firmicutes bacterium HGW-Firmicutes-16]
MTGSLQIKNDKYYIVINTYDKNGKRKPKWISSGLTVKGNKKRAEQILREKIREYEARESLVYSDMLFSDAIRQWLKSSAIRVDVVTLQGNEYLAKSQLLPYFDALQIKLYDVNRRVLQAYFDEKCQSGRIDGKGGLSPRSLRLHKNILFQTLKEAVRDGIIPNNPCEQVSLPQLQRFEAKFYSVEQLNALLEAIKDEPLYPLIKLAAVYGLRRSEVLGLKWDSVDFDAGTLTIKHTVTKVVDTVEKDKTKNAASHRSFPLMPEVKTLLIDLKEQERANRKLFGREYAVNDYILKWDDGRPFAPDYVTHRFSELLEKNGLPHIRFHELRHSCASFLINMGFTLKDVQEWLGHSDIRMTANIYSHLDVSRKKNMADMLSSCLTEKAI